MDSGRFPVLAMRPGAPFILFAMFFATLWLAGGASRGDVGGQMVVRLAACVVLGVAALLFRGAALRDVRPVLLLIVGAILIPVVQLVPLPPTWWQSLPGRDLVSEVARLAGQTDAWRPISISPGTTLNALFSLTVPVATFVLIANLKPDQRTWIPALMVVLVLASMLVGLLQFSGSGFRNPLINHVAGYVSGNFANRNHFALWLAIGCLFLPVWAFVRRDKIGWRGPVAIGAVLLLALTILASGSRAGIIVGALALLLAPIIVREQLGKVFRGSPRWALPVAIASVVAAAALLIVISFAAGRATSIDRLALADVGGDMRTTGLPTVLGIAERYFPVGAGMGSFDPAFRIAEPDPMLQLLYFNHAHNDLLELVLESGAMGIAVLIAAAVWWVVASARVWRRAKSSTGNHALGRLGSAIILLTAMASAVDYPARTPLMMAVLVVAGCLMAWGSRSVRDAASLPKDTGSL